MAYTDSWVVQTSAPGGEKFYKYGCPGGYIFVIKDNQGRMSSVFVPDEETFDYNKYKENQKTYNNFLEKLKEVT